MTSAVILGMVVTMFNEPRERARAIGIYSFVAAAGASIGLLAGGLLTQALNWHSIFLVNVPIGIATAFFALRLLESDRGIGLGKGADVVGAFLVTAALLLGVYTIIRTTDFGWGSTHTLGFGAASIASLIAFVVRESRTANPLVPLRIFRSRNISGANVVLCSCSPPCLGCSLWAVSTSSASLVTIHSASGSRSCRSVSPSEYCHWRSPGR